MNRKQRRAKGSSEPSIQNASHIPLSRPVKDDSRKTKTLLELAAEREAQLNPGARKFNPGSNPENIVEVKIGQDGKVIPNEALADTRSATPWLDAILLVISLAAIHFTLEILTVHQYAQELRYMPIVLRTLFVAFPTLFALVTLFHGLLLPITSDSFSRSVQRWILALRQLSYLVMANVAGCYLIHVTNDRGYYAVMKTAPAVGTIWVWAVLELGLLGALGGVVGPGLYAWWNGYGII
ncbi:hypothetical protein PV10_04445 [Exophiala mesophila]|uniref:DUF7719 domain-containing protein n=1 Tax=Exophiala mesophila TaxID=212818 RepID=A0A0D1WV61_EXOME|nr:uncharacterized protein PV10_04445 [Exophiala mesophila]KIV93210.1 hypothetical protein PV10_04445 [Exophiala mesophila]